MIEMHFYNFLVEFRCLSHRPGVKNEGNNLYIF